MTYWYVRLNCEVLLLFVIFFFKGKLLTSRTGKKKNYVLLHLKVREREKTKPWKVRVKEENSKIFTNSVSSNNNEKK